MQIAFAKIAVIASLLIPAINIAKTTPIAPATQKSDSYTFELQSLSNISIDYKWNDLMLVKNGAIKTVISPSLLSWELTSASGSVSGSFNDAILTHGGGKGTLSLNSLLAGFYSLSMTGKWSGASINGNGNNWSYLAPSANLKQQTFSATPVTAVPEPETFAMMLAGLGLMSTIAMRRKNKAA